MDADRLLRDRLDPLLLERGFAAAQGGVDADGGQLIWCIGYDALRARWPELPQAHDDHQEPNTGCCVDLVANVGAHAVLDDIRLEGRSLANTLAESGRPGPAARTPSFQHAPVSEVVDLVGAALAAALPL